MHILHLNQHFASREGSFTTRSYEFSRLLQDRGHRVTVLCGRSNRSGLPSQSGKLVDEYNIDGIRVLSLNVSYNQNMNYGRRMLSFIWFMVLACWIAPRQQQVDVILAASTPLTIAVPAIWTSLITRKPFIFEVRDLWPEVPIGLGILRNRVLIFLARTLEYITYHCARHIIALSPGMKEGILQRASVANKVTVIPSSCDNELFDVPHKAGRQFRADHPQFMTRPLVLYAGAFGFVNNLSYFIHLAHYTYRLDPDIGFLMIGDGAEAEKLRQLATDLGILNQNLWILPSMPKHQMPSVLSAVTIATSIFLNTPVMWSNSANKFFDALAAGKPVAINYQGWQADILRETGAGLVMNAEEPAKAATQLVEALHDSDWLVQAGQVAKRLARERFARESLVNTLEQVLLDAKLGEELIRLESNDGIVHIR